MSSVKGTDMELKDTWEIQSNMSQYNLQRICEEIEAGNNEVGGINLKPYYQRDYKFTRKDESLLIESLLGGIPIPIIYLASDTRKVPHISNVIDGQHRLMAVYRFMNNKFKLTGLKKYGFLNDLFFRDLDISIQNKLKYQISLNLQFVHIQNNPELELEIFTRYNQGTNPLTKQEIRNVVYDFFFNKWLNKYIKETLLISNLSSQIFNIMVKRFKDKSIHQELYVFFGIFKNLDFKGYSKIEKTDIEEGINKDYYSSPEYVIEFMSYARNLNELESRILINECRCFLELFIDVLSKVYIQTGVEYPLSKEIYETVKIRNHKAQTSIMMILTSVIYWVLKEKKYDFTNKKISLLIKESIKKGMLRSRFPTTTSSTTEPSLVIETIKFIKNQIEECMQVDI